MRAFIVVCLLAVACADKLGYNYQPVGHSVSGLSFTPGVSSGSLGGGIISSSSLGSGLGGSYGGSYSGGLSGGVSSGFTGGVSGGYNGGVSSGLSGGLSSGLSGGLSSGLSGGVSSGLSGGLSSGLSGGLSSGLSGGVSGGSYDGASVNYAPQAELEKEFYTFTANDDDFSEPAIQSQVANSAKKNLRVIFIKGPENHGLENAAVALAKHTAEQKTAIYVLHKQADVSSLSQKLNVINNNVNNKPEVHFVKYRTPEDAVNAQKAIQSQYDSLGGTSQSYNGGVAPVLNFASKAPVAAHVSHGSSGGSLGSSGGSLGSSGGSLGSSGGSLGSFGATGSLGSVGSVGSVGSIGSVGSVEASAPASSYIPPVVGGGVSVPSSSYLPSIVARHRK